ncbi:MAG: NADH-quinone oxidoreductase subunit C [Desulfovibrionaceae bacterium]|nr:NADH-quinone oxidoreductase subunit C [Desulfovibrionaceae bacterium]
MSFAYTHALALAALPCLSSENFAQELAAELGMGQRLLALTALSEETEGARLIALLALDDKRTLSAFSSMPLKSLPSLAERFPETQLFERELAEDFGLKIIGHPWLKPVRKTPDSGLTEGKRYPFFRSEGREVHEVAVGPVHAGIIEPGHFRFQCFGENVLHLEIALGYQHRGLEKLILNAGPVRRRALIECAAGDTSIGHALAYALVLERLSGLRVSEQSQHARTLALELERLANHIGDLGAIAGDTGFLPTSSWNGRIRGDVLTMTAIITGNRFGRGHIALGGVANDLDSAKLSDLSERLERARADALGSVKVMLKSASVLERLQGTGALAPKDAKALGLVGVSARACGLDRDARMNAPMRPELNFVPAKASSGDVLARVLVREEEMRASFAMVEDDLCALEELNHPCPQPANCPPLPASSLAVAQVEGFRGEIVHLAVTGEKGEIVRYKIIDPSFHNWPGLSLALRGNQISDFPLCNKSFNLSYCGHDL